MCREGGRGDFITSQVPGCSYTWHCLQPSPTPNSPTCSPSLPGSRDWGTREELPAVTTARDPKESNGEQAQALVSWIYFSFLSVSRVGFHRTLCSRGKHGFAAHGSGAGTGTSAPIPALARRLSPLPSMTLICLNLFFFCVWLFLFFPFFFFLLFNHFSSFLRRNSHWLSACRRLRKSSGTRGMVSFFHLAADLVEIIFSNSFFFYYKNKKMLQLSVLQGIQKSLKGQHKRKVLRYENLR